MESSPALEPTALHHLLQRRYTYVLFSLYNSINIHCFLALQNHHWAVQKSHCYGKFIQKSVVLPVQELLALCENNAESFHHGHLKKKKKFLHKKTETSFPFFPFEKGFSFAPDG